MGRSPEPQASARRCGCHHNATCSFCFCCFGDQICSIEVLPFRLNLWVVTLWVWGFWFWSFVGGFDLVFLGLNLYWVGVMWWPFGILGWICELAHCGFESFGVLISSSSSILCSWGWISAGILQVTVFQQDHYLHNFVQSTFDALPSEKVKGMVWMSFSLVDEDGNSI